MKKPRRKPKPEDGRLQEAAAAYGIKHTLGATLDVRAFCERYHLKREDFTRLSGFSPRAVALWVAGAAPAASARKTLVELQRLFRGLESVLVAERIGNWLHTAAPAFQGSTPLQVIERGEVDRIWGMIHALGTGEPG